MSTRVDHKPGSHTGGRIGHCGKRGGGRRKGSPTVLYTETEKLAARAPTVTTEQVRWMKINLPVRNEIVWKAGRQTPLHKHVTYEAASAIQLHGKKMEPACASCIRGAGPFSSCVKVPRSELSKEAQTGPPPFGGACANCYWGGQGRRCTFREDQGKGGKKPVRRSIFQDKRHSSIHLGKDLDLSSVDGIRDALNELDGLRLSLIERGKAIDADILVPEVSSESNYF